METRQDQHETAVERLGNQIAERDTQLLLRIAALVVSPRPFSDS